jgi:hypothetical protein
MTTDEILDHVLVPRPNGSDALLRVASFLEEALRQHAPQVELHAFTATPHGFQLVWTAALLLALSWATALLARRYGLALLCALTAPALLLMEFELLLSPVSGLLPLEEHNVVASHPGRIGAPTLVFTAHYDTATHFGDHFSWGPWGWRLGPATGLALGLALGGWALQRWRGTGAAGRRSRAGWPGWLALPAAGLGVAPFAAMFWFHAVGPVLREPSPGALDNAGSVAALLLLAERLEDRPAGAPSTVKIVFLAAEEERAMGSWAYARTLVGEPGAAVVNLESVGASQRLAWVVEDGFALRRFRTPSHLVDFVDAAAADVLGAPLPVLALPEGTLTDGRSFLAHGVPAVTLRGLSEGAFPRGLHSARDSRDRLSIAGIERAANLLHALVVRADRSPDALLPPPGAAPQDGDAVPAP